MSVDREKLADVIEECHAFLEGSTGDGAFSQIVNDWLEATEKPQRVLAKEFECAISTVSRWKEGAVEPHPMVKKTIVRELRSSGGSLLEAVSTDADDAEVGSSSVERGRRVAAGE